MSDKIKLYDFKSSPNCQRVKVVLEEKGLEYETVPVDLRKREQKAPEYLAMNPYGKVPVLVDGDTVLYESCIINEYLEEKYPAPPLLPADAVSRARIRILIDYGITHTNDSHQAIRAEMVKAEGERDAGALAAAKALFVEQLQPLERELEGRDYMAGDFSLLDAAHLPRVMRHVEWGVLPDPSLPLLNAWHQRMTARPSVRAIL
ncbi:MAG: glutathione S-transferase family protein [Deltaproteobacteria bacterium]|nr:glutathione S-transferase family protein [Deltaproteobacteria bacterium]